MFHDLGLTAGYRDSPLRFEVDGADAARDVLRVRARRTAGRLISSIGDLVLL